MEWIYFISRPKLSSLMPLAHNKDVSDTKPKVIWSLVTLFIIVVSIRFYQDASLMRKLRNFWMTSIQMLVVDTYLVILPHKEFFMLVTSSLPHSKIPLLQLEDVMHSTSRTIMLDYHLHHFILSSLLLDDSPNGALASWHVTPTWPRGIGTL